MSRRNAEEEANHWPGFVDALSTIVMVVTFLLIILAIVIFALSQMVAQELISEQNKQRSSEATTQVKSAQEAIIEVEESKEQLDTANETTSNKTTKSEFVPQLAEALKSQEQVDLKKDLSILSRKAENEREILVSAFEKTPDDSQVEVQNSTQLLTLKFDDNSTRINQEATDNIKDFIDGSKDISSGSKIVIWSFTKTKISSVSEAKRTAYYRALMARNELIKNGLASPNITTEIRFGSSPENENTVQVILQQ